MRNVQFWSCYFSSQQLFYSLFCPGGEGEGGIKRMTLVSLFSSLSLFHSCSEFEESELLLIHSSPDEPECKQYGLHTLATIDLSCSVRAIWAVTRWNENKSFKFSLPVSSSNMMLMKMFSPHDPPLSSAQHRYLTLFFLFRKEREGWKSYENKMERKAYQK